MSVQHVRIAQSENGSHVVAINGHEVQHATEALNLSIAAQKIPVLRLHLAAIVPDVATSAYVVLDNSTIEALKSMGWTPPGEQD